MKYLITVKFLGATDRRGSRYKVSAAVGRAVTSSYDYGASNPVRTAVYSWAAQNKLHLAEYEELAISPGDPHACAAEITPVL